MRLKRVVLPAPFGPMTLVTLPFAMSRSTAFTATRPPNRLVIRRTSSSAASPGSDGASRTAAPSGLNQRLHDGLAMQLGAALAAREDALRPEEHHQDERQTVDHELR